MAVFVYTPGAMLALLVAQLRVRLKLYHQTVCVCVCVCTGLVKRSGGPGTGAMSGVSTPVVRGGQHGGKN